MIFIVVLMISAIVYMLYSSWKNDAPQVMSGLFLLINALSIQIRFCESCKQ